MTKETIHFMVVLSKKIQLNLGEKRTMIHKKIK